MDRPRWLKQRKTERELPYEPPIWLGDLSNGEFYRPQNAHERRMRELILQKCDENARYVGMDMYGYPEMTPERRAKIFGLTASQLYRIDPKACRYAVDASKLASLRLQYDGEFGSRRWTAARPAIQTRRQFIELWKWRHATGNWG